MQLRLYSENDYESLKDWSLGHGVEVLPENFYKVGIIAYECKYDYAMAFLYMSNAGEGICFLSWLTTNPNNSVKESARSCKLVVEGLKKIAQEHNYGIMFTQATNGNASIWERMGWVKNHSVIPMLINLQEEN